MKTKPLFPHKNSLLRILIFLTVLFIAAQLSFFLIHHIVSGLYTSLANSVLVHEMQHTKILLPLVHYILSQAFIYILFVGWIWFIAVSFAEVFHFKSSSIYWLGITCWFLACCEILSLNAYFFPQSFFAGCVNQFIWLEKLNIYFAFLIACILIFITLIAYFNLLFFKRNRTLGCFLLVIGLSAGPLPLSTQLFFTANKDQETNLKPNIILIGIDSLRPDFVNYFAKQNIHTSHIDSFLQGATVFTDAYTPLARTFPAWVSILTAKYPKHNGARNNLMDYKPIIENETLAKRLQQEGYETIYATDENRFSNITHAYGFDRIIGPDMGVNDFLLAGLGDFPLSNLLINLPIGKFLFPYNYANRAAAITYKPNTFMQLMQSNLKNHTQKPIFLVVHLCITHWPFTWAHNTHNQQFNLLERYQQSIEAADQQLGELLQLLKNDGLLKNSLVVLLSDHGTTLGVRGDRFIAKSKYIGNTKDISIFTRTRLSSAPVYTTNFQRDFSLSATYGHGTDILGLKQNRVLLAFKVYGTEIPHKDIAHRCVLIDIAPTILDFLHLKKMQNTDGLSLWSDMIAKSQQVRLKRPIFLETADKFPGIETDKIDIPKVVKERISAYRIDLNNGLLYLEPTNENTYAQSKQHAILQGDWLLVSYPVKTYNMSKSYFILINVNRYQWTLDLSSSFAKTAPIKELLQELKDFYKDEI